MSDWRQFHADGPSTGFALEATRPAVEPKWRTEVGRVGYGSPVIGPDGVVYIGTLDDELLAVNPDGTIRWRHEITPGHSKARITGSPAVDRDGNVYVIATKSALAADHRSGNDQRKLEIHSTLYSFDSAGNERWLYHFPPAATASTPGGFTMSSPKIYDAGQETFIFIPIKFGTHDFALDIMVLDQAGEIVHRTHVVDYPPSGYTAGSNIDDFFRKIGSILSIPITGFDQSGVEHRPLQEQFGWPEPTIAIADFPPHDNRPIIVVEDSYKTLTAYRWQNRLLTKLWSKVDNKYRGRSSPAIFTNGTIALGQEDGTVALYGLTDGREYAKPWYKGKKAVYSPPVSFGRQLYLAAEKEVVKLESDSEFIQNRPIGTSLGAPALSANHLYVSADDGLWTFDLALQQVAKNTDFSGGVSSPAIANDSTVYAIDIDGVLWAFGTPVTQRETRTRDHRKTTPKSRPSEGD